MPWIKAPLSWCPMPLTRSGIYPEHLIPVRVGRILCVSHCPLGGSIRCELRVADGLAQALLDGSFDLVSDSLDATIFHNTAFRALSTKLRLPVRVSFVIVALLRAERLPTRRRTHDVAYDHLNIG